MNRRTSMYAACSKKESEACGPSMRFNVRDGAILPRPRITITIHAGQSHAPLEGTCCSRLTSKRNETK